MGNVFKIKHFILLTFSKVTMLSRVLSSEQKQSSLTQNANCEWTMFKICKLRVFVGGTLLANIQHNEIQDLSLHPHWLTSADTCDMCAFCPYHSARGRESQQRPQWCTLLPQDRLTFA